MTFAGPTAARALLAAVLALGLALAVAAGPAPAQPAATARPAPRADAQAESAVLQAVRRAIAEYFGVDPREISEQTDLVRDLRADPMDALDVLAIICAEHDVEVPRRADLTTVLAIVEYVRSAPRVGAAVVVRGGAPAAAPPPREPVVTQRVFYATDRLATGSGAPNEAFGGQRAPGGRLSYGIAEVTIPVAAHARGQEERPSIFALEIREDPEKHIVLKGLRPLERVAFLAQLRGRLDAPPAGGTRDVFVFVHGYNVSFDRAARRTAQIAYDLGFPGVPMFFSWPSAGRFTAYFSDRESAEWAVPHLEQLLQDLVAQLANTRVHLIAHSMGNQVVIRALDSIALRRGEKDGALLDNVILAAPDFDAQVFTEQVAPRVVALARRWTVYASDKDLALDASAALAARRLGLPLQVTAGIDTVDASGIDVAPWSVPEFHTYFASKQRVIADLAQVLRGIPPERRELTRQIKAGLPYWVLEPL